MSLLDHAEMEMRNAWADENGEYDPMQYMVVESIRQLMGVFVEQRHSGFSANYTLSVFEKLARFESLTPLTGEDWEWVSLDYAPEMRWQNKRDGRVFKRSDGTAYFIDGKVFREPNGCCYTNSDSVVEVTFPYTPKTEYVDIEEEE